MCRQVEICANPYEVAAPTVLPPMVAAPSVPPPMVPAVPPPGTSRCEMRNICSGPNQCLWQQVCQ